jgi:hypothetical protein
VPLWIQARLYANKVLPQSHFCGKNSAHAKTARRWVHCAVSRVCERGTQKPQMSAPPLNPLDSSNLDTIDATVSVLIDLKEGETQNVFIP